jgi:hypothetical protein
MDQQNETQNVRNRRAFCQEVALDPASRVGSWFLKLDGFYVEMQGIVVGEPQAGVYLVDTELGYAQRRVQVVVKLDQMVEEGWQFFDTEEAVRFERALLLADQEALR